MLPTFRLFIMAVGVVIAALALTGRGLVTPSEGYTRIGDVPGVGRALVQQAMIENPDARRLHMLASARRTEEVGRLRALLTAPLRSEPDTSEAVGAESVAARPASDPIADLLGRLPGEPTSAVAPADDPAAETPEAAPAVAQPDTPPPAGTAPEVVASLPDTPEPAPPVSMPASDAAPVETRALPAAIEDTPRPDVTQQARLSEADDVAARADLSVAPGRALPAIAPALPRPRPAALGKPRRAIVHRARPIHTALPRTAAPRARVHRAAARQPVARWNSQTTFFGPTNQQTSGQ